jgi:hypothetical protein
MPTSSTPVLVQTPKLGLAQIVNADASNKKTVVTAGANGSKLTALTACSDDTSARIVQVIVTRSATDYILASVPVPAGSGTDGSAAAVNLLNATILPGLSIDNDGQRYLFLESGDTLAVKATTTVTAAKTVAIAAGFGNF